MTTTRDAVAGLVAEGMTDKQIAVELTLSVATVRYHVATLCRAWKLDRGRNIRVQITRHVLGPSVSDSRAAA